MLDWRYFILLPEVKDLPVDEQKRLFLSEQTQQEYFQRNLISEQMLHLTMMQSMAVGSGGPRKYTTSTPTTSEDTELLTEAGNYLMTEAGAYLITQ